MYLRISQDRAGDGTSIDRQRQDCQKLAAVRGWTITEEFMDRDVSAYSAKPRPQFEALLKAIEAKEFDALVAYHPDRLMRRPFDLERLVNVCTMTGTREVATVAGDTNLGDGDGLAMLRMLSLFSAHQSDSASRRIKRKNEERAAAGLPHVTGQRSYGFELDRVTVVESEAIVIRELVSRFLAGDSLISLASWLQAEGIKTATGKNDWRVPTVRSLLWKASIAGLLERHGEIVGPGKWQAIITVAQHEQIRHRLEQNARTGKRSARNYLLSGKVYCGGCGAKMVSSPDGDRARYGCVKGPDHGGCSKVFIAGGPLEDLIADAVLTRLDQPELAQALAARPDDDAEAAVLTQQLVADSARKDELALAFGNGEFDRRDWHTARKPIEDRIDAARRRLARLGSHNGLAQYIGRGAQLRAQWDTPEMTLQTQAAIVSTILSRVVIFPATARSNRMDPARVVPEWTL